MGKFAEKVAEMLDQPQSTGIDWRERLAGQQQRMGTHVISSQDEAMARAKTLLKQLQDMSYQTGFGLRSQQHSRGGVEQLLDRDENAPGVPGREKLINFPVKQADWFEPRLLSKEALLEFATEPIHNKLEDMMVNLRNTLGEKKLRGTRITSDPMTIPTFAPSVALSVPKSFVSGYQDADKAQSERLRGDMDHRLEKARQEFDNALKDEYAASHQKAASAGEFIDGLAQWWVKQADGEMNKVLGMYLAAAGLLGVGGHAAAKSIWEKHDPRYQRLKAMQDMIKMRQRHTQLPVLVTEEHLPEEADETPLAAPPGQLGTESIADTVPNQTTKVGGLRNIVSYAGNEAISRTADHIGGKLAKHRPKKKHYDGRRNI